ncbi:MAG: hypothetical protein C4K58_08530 [Flavobacteriaceae bacterium]|nr:MAG: hypothetical protein C4K58_08530 [Flavobacteriaceae bacterium]
MLVRENLEIKVCGNKFPTNALAVCQLQIDYMGFIFHEESPRNVENFEIFDVLNKASLEGFSPKRVGVFVSKTEDEVLNKVRKHNLQIVQAHGLESPLFCQKLKEEGLEVWKV